MSNRIHIVMIMIIYINMLFAQDADKISNSAEINDTTTPELTSNNTSQDFLRMLQTCSPGKTYCAPNWCCTSPPDSCETRLDGGNYCCHGVWSSAGYPNCGTECNWDSTTTTYKYRCTYLTQAVPGYLRVGCCYTGL